MRRLVPALLAFILLPVYAYAIHQVNYTGEFPQIKPVDVAVDENNKLYIVDENGFVYVKTESGELTRSWGNADPLGAWKIKKPGGIAVYGDKVYITDAGTGQVLIFNKEGSLTGKFDSHGSSPEMYNLPSGIDVFGGVIYVADSVNKKIQVFGPDGIFIGSIGDAGHENIQPGRPVDLAVDYKGYVYVADVKKNMVMIYHPNGRHARNVPFEEPVAVSMDKDGFYVAGADYKISKFAFNGDELFTFGTPGAGRAQFGKISGLAVNKDGMVLASDYKNGSVQYYLPERKTILFPEKNPPPTAVKGLFNILADGVEDIYWGEDERLYGVSTRDKSVVVIKGDQIVKGVRVEGTEPVAVARDKEGYLWVLDGKKETLLKIDGSGVVRFSIGSSGDKEGQFSDPSDIAITSRGFVVVADTGNSRIQIFNQSGVFLAKAGPMFGVKKVLESPVAIGLDSEDNIYVVDDERYAVVKFSPEGKHLEEFGKEGKGPGQFRKPKGILVSNGEVFVVDKENNNVQIFDLEGNFLRLFGSWGGETGFSGPTSITVKEKTQFFVSDTGNGKIKAIRMLYTPEPPSTVLARGGMRKIDLSWPQPDKETKGLIEKYIVYRSDNPATDFKQIASVVTTNYTDFNVNPDRPYFYRVAIAAKDGNTGIATRPVEARADKYTLEAPKGLTAEATDTEVALKWEPVTAASFSHYVVYRKELGLFQLLGTVKTPAYTETGLRRGKKCIYRVTTFTTDGVESPYAEVRVRTLTKKPSGKKEKAEGDEETDKSEPEKSKKSKKKKKSPAPEEESE